MTVRSRSVAFALALATASAPALAELVYANSTNDTLVTYFYSTGAFTQLGDAVTLGGTARRATDAAVQFFNNGTASGSFDAVLSLYAGVNQGGGLLGTATTSAQIGSGGILTVSFTGLDFVVTDELRFAVSLANVAGGLDLGLNAFQPPTVGSSASDSLLFNSGSGLLTGVTAPGAGNLYFVLNADPVSVAEPATGLLAALSLWAAGCASRRRPAAPEARLRR